MIHLVDRQEHIKFSFHFVVASLEFLRPHNGHNTIIVLSQLYDHRKCKTLSMYKTIKLHNTVCRLIYQVKVLLNYTHYLK